MNFLDKARHEAGIVQRAHNPCFAYPGHSDIATLARALYVSEDVHAAAKVIIYKAAQDRASLHTTALYEAQQRGAGKEPPCTDTKYLAMLVLAYNAVRLYYRYLDSLAADEEVRFNAWRNFYNIRSIAP